MFKSEHGDISYEILRFCWHKNQPKKKKALTGRHILWHFEILLTYKKLTKKNSLNRETYSIEENVHFIWIKYLKELFDETG